MKNASNSFEPAESSAPTSPSVPLVLFCYRRHELLKHVLEALSQQNEDIPLLIAYVDGPRTPEAEADIRRCIALLEETSEGALQKTRKVIIPRTQNLGCRDNIRLGLDDVFEQYTSAIILEEDLVPNPYFYASLKHLLRLYAETPNIASVSGYAQIRQNPFFNQFPELLSTLDAETNGLYQSPLFCCWGWGTWQNRWRVIGPDVHQAASLNTLLRIPFTGSSAAAFCLYLTWLLKTINSWATPFQAHSLLRGFEHVGPTQSLLRNIGFHGPHAEHTLSDEGTINDDFNPAFHLLDSSASALSVRPLVKRHDTFFSFLGQLRLKFYYKIKNLLLRRELHLGHFYLKI